MCYIYMDPMHTVCWLVSRLTYQTCVSKSGMVSVTIVEKLISPSLIENTWTVTSSIQTRVEQDISMGAEGGWKFLPCCMSHSLHTSESHRKMEEKNLAIFYGLIDSICRDINQSTYFWHQIIRLVLDNTVHMVTSKHQKIDFENTHFMVHIFH